MYDLPPKTSRQALLRIFSVFGGITRLEIASGGHSAFITFATEDALRVAALEIPNTLKGARMHTIVDECDYSRLG